MCSEGKVESQRLRTGKLAADDWPRLTAACDKLAKAPIYVDDTGSITMMEIRSKLRRLKSQCPDLGLVIVDYLQLMTSGTNVENRVQEVSQISRSLKVLARDLEVPILALSQLSRAVEQRHDKRPILSDLRESGCLAGDTPGLSPGRGRLPADPRARRAERFPRPGARHRDVAARAAHRHRAFATGQKPVFLLTTRLGHQIRATANHKFLAFDGWRRLDDLAPGMRLCRAAHARRTGEPTMSDAELASARPSDRRRLHASAARDAVHLEGLGSRRRSSRSGAAASSATLCGRGSSAERTWYQTYLTADGRLTHGVRNPVAAWLDDLGAFGAPRAREARSGPRVRTGTGGSRGLPPPPVGNRRLPPARYGRRGYPAIGTTRRASGSLATCSRCSCGSASPPPGASCSMGAKGRPSHRLTVSGKTDVERFLSLVGRRRGAEERLPAKRSAESLEWMPANTNRDTIPAEAWQSIVAPEWQRAESRPELCSLARHALLRLDALSQRHEPGARSARRRDRRSPSASRQLATSDVYWDRDRLDRPATARRRSTTSPSRGCTTSSPRTSSSTTASSRTPTSSCSSTATSTTTRRTPSPPASPSHRREAPQRPDRHDEARVPEAVREVLRPGGRLSGDADDGLGLAERHRLLVPLRALPRARAVDGRSLFEALHAASVRGSIAGRDRRRVRALPRRARDRDPPRRTAARPDPHDQGQLQLA